jgi:hypothetical protein
MDIERINSLVDRLTASDYERIMVGAGCEVDKFHDLDKAIAAAVHCVLNGPVGVNKLTTFPGVDAEVRIKDLYASRLSNKMWKAFCSVIAERVRRTAPAIADKCQQTKLNGDVWPLNENH